jgi:Protein of unknown function (DUF3987)
MATIAFRAADARLLFENLDQIHLVYLHPNGVGVHGKEFGTDVEAALEDAARANANGFNIYWTVNYVRPGLNKKPDKASITHARFVHVDIDPPKTGGAFDKREITAALGEIDQPPSFIIDSGGGLQAFWRLDGPCQNLASIEHINTQARDWFDADACQNIDRLMRVPGSVNYPNKTKLARGRTPCLASWAEQDSGLTYEPETLAASFPAAKSAEPQQPIAANVPQNVDLVTADDLGLGELDPIRLAIEAPVGQDRSGDGLAVARLMANAGHTDAQIVGVLLNPANAVSGHFLDQRHSLRAAARAVQLVRQDSLPPPDTAPGGMSDPEIWGAFLASCKAKVRATMVPPQLRTVEDDTISPVFDSSLPSWRSDLGDGPLAQFIDYTTATAASAQPWVTLGAALAMFGAAAGRRYSGPTGLRTNIYAIALAKSGGGKDRPLRVCTDLMVEAGLQSHVGTSKIASGAGLVTAVTRNPSIVFPLDEVGFLFSAITDRKRAPKHQVEIMDTLTEFYSLAGSTFLGTAYANDKEKPREVITQPCLSIFGVTTPAIFWSSLSNANVLDGSLARLLIFESDNDYPDINHDIGPTSIPESLIEAVKAVAQGAEGHNPFPLGNSASAAPKPYTVPYADQHAILLAREMRDEQVRMLRQYSDTNLTGIIARLAENAFKIALIKAVTDNPARPEITVADLTWGMSIARVSVDAHSRAVTEQIADTPYEAEMKKVLKVIARAGSAGIDGNKLSRDTQFADRRKRADILAHLEESKMIRVMEMPKAEGARGPAKKIYFDIS